MLQFSINDSTNKKIIDFYISYLEDELAAIKEISKANKTLFKSNEGKDLRGWKQQCQSALRTLKERQNKV